MLGISKKPGPPVPPRPSAAAVATALAKQRENSPSPTGTLAGKSVAISGGGGGGGMATLKPPHPGRTVVYRSPDFGREPLPSKNVPHLSTFGASSLLASSRPVVQQQAQSASSPIPRREAIHHSGSGEGEKSADHNGVLRSPLASAERTVGGKLLSVSNGVMYRSTCSIVEINTSSSSGSSSASSSPVATLQKQPEQKARAKVEPASPSLVVPVARRRMRPGGDANPCEIEVQSDVIIVNGTNGGSTISLSSAGSSLHDEENDELVKGGRHSRKTHLPGSGEEEGDGMGEFHDSGTERGDSSGSSASAGSTLERENNIRNCEAGGHAKSSSSSNSSHFTEIIIGSNQSSTVVRSGSKPNVAARTTEPGQAGTLGGSSANVIRSSSIRVPISAVPPPPYHRPEPEGGEHVHPSGDNSTPVGTVPASPSLKKSQSTMLDAATLDSKLSEKKFAFHELLISELTAMRQKQQQQQQKQGEQKAPKDETKVREELAQPEGTGGNAVGGSPMLGVDLAKINRRQRFPSERRSSCSESETSPNGTAARLPKIRTADWIEVGDNGKQVVLSSCQISLEDSGMEDEEKLDDASSGVGDSWDSVKEDAEERIIMSLPGLPPLPKSLSGFDLAGIQFQSHHHHLPPHHLHHQQQHHHPTQPQHNPHYPPHHPPPPHLQQSMSSHPSHHHQQQQQQQQSFHGMSASSALPPSSQVPAAATLNHHHTNPFIPISSPSMLLHAASSLDGPQPRGHSPVGSTLSGGSSGSGRKPSPQPPVSQSAVSGPASTTTLDTQLAILRREMYGLRQLDLSLLSQLWALNESIQEFRTMLQEQETLSPPSPSPSNSDVNSVSSDDDLDEEDSSAATNSNRLNLQQLQQHQQQQQHQLLLSAHHALQSSTNSIVGAGGGSLGGGGGGTTSGSGGGGGGGGGNANESGGSTTTTLSSSASSRMRAPPPPPPNRKAPSRPV